MSTWHNAADVGEVAETILLPGDPLRAKFIAENYLEDVECFNHLRCNFGYTGYYKGKRLSVMATGMGIPAMGIYSYELINEYKCKNLIRIGTIGAIQPEVKLGDIVMAMGSCGESSFADQFELPGHFSAVCDYSLLKTATLTAEELEVRYHVGNVVSQDVLYCEDKVWQSWKKMGILGLEMEAYGLYCNATRYGAKALAIFTNTCNIGVNEQLNPNDAENNMRAMIELALETAIKL